MLVKRTRYSPSLPSKGNGFTMIEVLIAILVLAVGLLGFAMLQTMNLRFVQSANHRTQATNLAYDLLDQMRSNRLLVAQYTSASFTGGTATNCSRPIGGSVSIEASVARWQCQVRAALGESAAAVVTYADGTATVSIRWGDERWRDPDARTTFTVATRI